MHHGGDIVLALAVVVAVAVFCRCRCRCGCCWRGLFAALCCNESPEGRADPASGAGAMLIMTYSNAYHDLMQAALNP